MFLFIYIYIAFGKSMSAFASFPHLWLSLGQKTMQKKERHLNFAKPLAKIRCVRTQTGVSVATFYLRYTRSSATVEAEKFPFNKCLLCESCTFCHARSAVLSRARPARYMEWTSFWHK